MKMAFELTLPNWEIDTQSSCIDSVATLDSGSEAQAVEFVEIEIDVNEDTPVWELINELFEDNLTGKSTNSNPLSEALDGAEFELLKSGLRNILDANYSETTAASLEKNSTTPTRAPLLRTSCTAHTLQLVVKDGLVHLPVSSS